MGRLGHEQVFYSIAAKDNLASPLLIFLVELPIFLVDKKPRHGVFCCPAFAPSGNIVQMRMGYMPIFWF
jgi:hypothetical protein